MSGIKNRWLHGISMALAVLAGAGGGYLYTTPVPPDIDLRGAPPAVAEAVATARHAVEQSPRSGSAWGELAMVLQANDYAFEAYICFIQAERFDREAAIWPYMQALRLIIHDREAALASLRRSVTILDRTASPDATPRLLLADLLFEKDQRVEAAALCRQVLAYDAGNPRAHFNLGLIALADDDPKQGIQHLLRAADSPYTGRRSCLHLAVAYQRLGDAANAADVLRRAKELPPEPTWPDPYVQKIREYEAGPGRHEQRAVGRPGEYLLALRDLAEESGDGVAFYRWGMALADQADYPAAEAALETAVRKKSPELFKPRFALGVVLLRQGQQLEAKSAAPAVAQAQFRKAEEYLRQAAERRPAYGLAHLSLGQALQGLGRRDEALAQFRTAVQCQPELPNAHLALAEALADVGEWAEATRHLDQAQSLAPADLQPAIALARLRIAAKKTAAPGKQ